MVPVKILIVEDELIIALFLKNQLKKLGYEIVGQAATGEQAIQQAWEAQPDIVLMDVHLKGQMDGVEAAEYIRLNCHIPVIYLTAYSDNDTIERAKITEPYAYLNKPIEEHELNTTIEMALHKHATEQRLRQQIVDALPEGTLLIDANWRLMVANVQAQEYLALISDVQVGERLQIIGDYTFDQLLAAEGEWHELIIDGQPPRIFDVMMKSAKKQTSLSEISWVILLQDMTDRRLAQQRAQQQEHLAAIGLMAAGIAHDFNNMLSVLTLGNYLLLETEPDLQPINKERLQINVTQIKRASELINQVLDFSRQSYAELQPVDLIPISKENLKMLQRIIPENIDLDFCFPTESCVVNADPTRMQQIVTNLVVNARDAMPNGGHLKVEMDRIVVASGDHRPLPEMTMGNWIKLTVSDDGSGIEPHILAHIFEPFFTTKAPGQGTGLGLAQVFGIVQQHSGLIDVQSSVGVGTTFTIYLPEMDDSAATKNGLAPITSDHGQGCGATILIVEDDFMLRRNLRDVLEKWQYLVLEASNGREALSIFDRYRSKIRVVLSDLVMPEMSGLELCRELRRQSADLQMVMMTGYLPDRYAQELKLLDVTCFLQKPLVMEELSDTLSQTCLQGTDPEIIIIPHIM